MSIDYTQVASALQMQMNFAKDSNRALGKVWGVSPMSITNALKGQSLSAELLMRIAIYTGTNPLQWWVNESVQYEGMKEKVSPELGYPL